MGHVKEGVFWIDVRTAEEFSAAHVEVAVNIPHEEILAGVKQLKVKADDTLYLYCRSGKRVGVAMAELEKAGFSNMTNLMSLEAAQAFFTEYTNK